MKALIVTLIWFAVILVWITLLSVFFRVTNGWAKIAAKYKLNAYPNSSDAWRAFLRGIRNADPDTLAELRRLRLWNTAASVPVLVFAAVIVHPLALLLFTPILVLTAFLKPLDVGGAGN